MNPLTNVKNINKLNETELAKGTVNKKSWHDLYKGSAWIFIGGLAYGLTEGDILSVFSQYGEIVNINLVRDKKTGKTKGFCFLCYANQKSTILAVDNLNGIKLCARTLRVDHVANYKPPKDNEHDDEITKMLKSEGCAPKRINEENSTPSDEVVQKKKQKKHKKEKKKHKKRNRENPDVEFSISKVKKEKVDEGYSKYEFPEKSKSTPRKNELTEDTSSDDSSDYDSPPVSRKEKHESHKFDRNLSNTVEKLSRLDKSRTNKHDKHYTESSKRKPSKDGDSCSESDNHSNRKRKYVDDNTNGLTSEKSDFKHRKYTSRNSSSDEESHKTDHRNLNSKDRNVKISSSRHHRRDSSGSDKDCNFKESFRTKSKDREKYGGRDSLERERNSFNDRRQQNSHSSYRDHGNRESPHKTDRHNKERRDYDEKYERFDKNRDNRREYGKHRSHRKEK